MSWRESDKSEGIAWILKRVGKSDGSSMSVMRKLHNFHHQIVVNFLPFIWILKFLKIAAK